MRCPICQIDLLMSGKQGIEIDYCPKCRGIWLDRGELDKIIERSSSEPPPQPAGNAVLGFPKGGRHFPEREKHKHDDVHGHGYRRNSFLSDLFD